MLELDAKPLNQSPLGALYTQEEWLVVFLSFLRRENDATAGKKMSFGSLFSLVERQQCGAYFFSPIQSYE